MSFNWYSLFLNLICTSLRPILLSITGVGDIKNKGLNTLVVITGEGQCYLFDVPKPGLDDLEEALPLSS